MELLIIIVLCQSRWVLRKNSQANTIPISTIRCWRLSSISPANDRWPALNPSIDGINICLTLISNRNPKRAYARTTIAHTHNMFLFSIRLSTTYGLRCQFFSLHTCISILFSVHSLQHIRWDQIRKYFSFSIQSRHSVSFTSLIPPITSKYAKINNNKLDSESDETIWCVVIAYVNPCTMWFTQTKNRVALTGCGPSSKCRRHSRSRRYQRDGESSVLACIDTEMWMVRFSVHWACEWDRDRDRIGQICVFEENRKQNNCDPCWNYAFMKTVCVNFKLKEFCIDGFFPRLLVIVCFFCI